MKNIEKGTIIRTIILAIALINQMLVVAGKSPLPIEDKALTEVLSTAFTIITALVAWWKNNSFTSAAIGADKVMRNIKKGGKLYNKMPKEK